MRKIDCVLGVDMGTGGARVGIFDLKGNPIVFCEEPYPLYTPASGRAEQKPSEWWDSICKASKRAMAESDIDPACIKGMSVDTTCCTVVLSGDDMEPLRDAIMWMDVRASEQAKRIYESGHDALKYNGYGMVSAECLPAKALWLKENEPETYNKATRFYECTDWLMYKLTGEYTASINCASVRWYYNNEEGGYPIDFYNTIGLDDLVEKLPERVVPLGELVGGLMSVLSLPIMDLIYNTFGKNKSAEEVVISSHIMSIYALGIIFVAIGTPICSTLQAVGRADIPLKALAAGVVMKIALNYILVGIPEINIQGAGIGTLVCYLFVCAVTLFSLKKQTKVSLDFTGVFLKPLLCALICGATAWASQGLMAMVIPYKLSTVIAIALAAVAYVFALFLTKTVTSKDLATIPKCKKIIKVLEKFGMMS